jgi:hypothetical protein
MTLVSYRDAKNSHVVPRDEDIIIGLFDEKNKIYFGLNASNPTGGWASLPDLRYLRLP